MRFVDVLVPDRSNKSRRTETIQLHCTPEERELIEHEATLRAGGNVDAYLLGLVKFGWSFVAEKNT